MEHINKTILFVVCLCCTGFVTNAQSTKKAECIKTINDYYDALKAYTRYYGFNENNIVSLFHNPEDVSHNIVQVDLRVFQKADIPQKSNLKNYLDAIIALRNDGRPPSFEYTIKESSYRESTRNGSIISTIDVDKWIKCGNERKRFSETITLVDGKIIKITSESYTPPKPKEPTPKPTPPKPKESTPKPTTPKWVKEFFAPAEEGGNFYITASTFGPTFGYYMSGTDDYWGGGMGIDAVTFYSSHISDLFVLTLYGSASFNMQYLGLGSLFGVGYHTYPDQTETIDGVSILIRESPTLESSFFLQVSPYAELRISALRLMFGYDFHLLNGKELNGIRLGIGIGF